jgi:hypothetical protein
MCLVDQSSVFGRHEALTPIGRINAGCPQSVWAPATEDAIILAVERDPSRSSRDIARELELPQVPVLNTLHDDELQPYHYLQNQHQLPEDRPLRMQFCEWSCQQHAADALYENILWTDEGCFTREGVFNVQNSHLWSRASLHATRALGYQVCFSLNVYRGGHPRGPLLLPRRLDARRYCVLIQTAVPGLLEDVSLPVRQGLWFWNDGVLPLWEKCPGVVRRDVEREVD